MIIQEIEEAAQRLVMLKNDQLQLKINPKRGNLITSLMFHGNECIYIDENNYHSDERPRCGCPVLFPYCGNNSQNRLNLEGHVYETGIHGVVHTNVWNYEGGINEAVFTTHSTSASKQAFPYDFKLEARLSLDENKVIYQTTIINQDSRTMPCDLGFHPFFTISGLHQLSFETDTQIRYQPVTKKTYLNADIEKLMICDNGLILKNTKQLVVKDTGYKRAMILRNESGFENFMLWSGNPDAFLVVEPLTSQPDAINDKLNKYNLKPAASVTACWSFEYIAL